VDSSSESIIRIDSLAVGEAGRSLARILRSWRCSYCGIVGKTTGLGEDRVREYFSEMIRVSDDREAGRGQWQIPRVCLAKRI